METEDPDLERKRRAATQSPAESDPDAPPGNPNGHATNPSTAPTPPAASPTPRPAAAPTRAAIDARDQERSASMVEEAARMKAEVSAILARPGKPTVDKYFGSKLPPVCRQLGCYVTDDGKFYYCINPHCHKDRKRETKYNRRRTSLVYFFCPKCKSREIQLHLKKNQYECLECAYSWRH